MDKITKLTINTYNNIAEQYTKDFFDNEDDIVFVDKFVEYLNGTIVLDMGCGPGNLTKELVRHNCNVTGIDLSEKMIEIAKQKVPSAKFEIQDIRKTNYDNKTFDGLFVSRALIHIKNEEIQNTLQEFYRILKSNGTLGIIVQIVDIPFEHIEKEVYNPELDIFFKYFSEQELHTKLLEANFSIKHSEIQKVRDVDSGEIVKKLFVIARK